MPGKLAITISAEDRASNVLVNLNKRIAAMSAPAERTRKEFGRLAESTGLRTVARATNDLAHNSGQMVSNFTRAVPIVSALAGALSAAGAAEALRRFSEYGRNLEVMARQANVSVPQLQQMGNLTAMVSGNFQGGVEAAANLNEQLYKMRTGQGDTSFIAALSTDAMKGVDVQNMPVAKAYDAILHRLAAVKDAQAQLQLGTAIFGSSFRTTLWPAVMGGTEALDKYLAISRQVVQLTPNQIESLGSLYVSFNRLGQDVESLAGSIIAKLAPAIGMNVDQLSEWIEKNQDLIASEIGDTLKSWYADFQSIASGANSVVNALGGWKPVLTVLFDLMAARFAITFIAPFASAAVGIAKVTRALYVMQAAARAALAAETAAETGGISGILGSAAGGAGSLLGGVGLGAIGAVGGIGALLYELSKTPTTPQEKADSAYSRQTLSPRLGGPSMVSRTATDKSLDPTMRGFLDAIAAPESHGDYNAKNPGSSARGRYQFIDQTWAEEVQRLGLKDDSPASQDRAAADLAERRYRTMTGRDLLSDLKSGGKEAYIAAALGGTWPSLPGGTQSRESLGTFTTLIDSGTFHERQADAAAGAPATLNTPTPGTDVNLKGGAQLTVRLSGAPPGTQTSATTSGNVFAGPARVEQMPDSGLPALY